MAKPDHKALARPSIPLEGSFSPFRHLPHLLPKQSEVTPHGLPSTPADIAIATRVLQNMLDESDALHRAVSEGRATDPSRWPLMGPHTMCFEETMHYLREYGRVLGHE